MRRVRLTAAVVVILAVAVGAVRVLAYNHSFNFWSFQWGGSSPLIRTLEASASAFAGYTEGGTWLMVRIEGFQYGRYCWAGNLSGDWCEAGGTPDIAGYVSNVHQRVESQVLNGCYTATMILWVDGNVRENYPIGHCWYPPPPPYDPASTQEECNEVAYYWGWTYWTFDGGYGSCSGYNASPIIIATGPGRNYTLEREARVMFDINADGFADLITWTRPDSDVAFLALDRNGNGQIDDGRELFGDVTTPGQRNGFEALRAMAGLEMGHIDAENGGELWTQLLLWHDRNQNGISEPGELSPASSTLDAIGLGYTTLERTDGANAFKFRGWARKLAAPGQGKVERTLNAPAREFPIYDVLLSR